MLPPDRIPPGGVSGTRYERLVVLRMVSFGRKAKALCKCDCGTEKEIRLDSLKAGKTVSCGCLLAEARRAEKPSRQGVFADILHKRFGRLIATGLLKEPGKGTQIVCRCDCGAQTLTTAGRLRSGDTISCGCFHKERQVEEGQKTRAHGHAVDGELASGHTSIYRAWQKVLGLCRDAKKRGAGRVNSDHDPRWLDFQAFLQDFGEIGFLETICRKDQSLPWTKSNCYVGLGPQDRRRKTREQNAEVASKKGGAE